ncbi:fibronectin type III-like domain-contianing protein [Actinomadura madurae]|uniref:fibronectin type III-like domain-contianing protein n=1 Tax=Actinomadura madurae TaxID=1993 RepID=UPI0027E33600|nr:fibronectin type III-like domain-contianing protein [Actinomadura madurae]
MERGRPRPAVPVRPRPDLDVLRVRGAEDGRAGGDRRDGLGRRRRPQHRGPRGHGGRPAVPVGSGRVGGAAARWLAGWARIRLEPGEAARIEFEVHADRTSFTGPDLRRIVEPGVVEAAVGRSSADLPLRGSFTLEGPVRELGTDRVLTVPVKVTPL